MLFAFETQYNYTEYKIILLDNINFGVLILYRVKVESVDLHDNDITCRFLGHSHWWCNSEQALCGCVDVWVWVCVGVGVGVVWVWVFYTYTHNINLILWTTILHELILLKKLLT